jgi:hypothetical protein
MSHARIIEIAKSKFPGSPSGVASNFVSLSNKHGIKIFNNYHNCCESYEIQEMCHHRGWGPAVGDLITLPNFNRWGETFHGYITEKLKTVVPPCIYRMGIPTAQEDRDEHRIIVEKWEVEWEYIHWAHDNTGRLAEHIDTMEVETDWRLCDAHCYNWGYLNSGKMVPIDFGND